MANWSVVRIQSQPPGAATVECLDGNTPTTVILKDLDTGTYSTVTLCMSNTETDPCAGLLQQLHDAGYNPNDWAAGCA